MGDSRASMTASEHYIFASRPDLIPNSPHSLLFATPSLEQLIKIGMREDDARNFALLHKKYALRTV